MQLNEQIFLFILNFFSSYPHIVAFLAPVLAGGEFGVLIASFFSAKDMLPFWSVVFFGTLGLLFLDSLWFFIIKSKPVSKIKNWNKLSKRYLKLEKKLNSFSGGNDFILLFISKVLFGTRILTILYLGIRKISFFRFLSYNILPTFLWALFISLFGWFSGKGFYNLYETYHDLKIALFFLFVIGILVYMSIKLLTKNFLKRNLDIH